MHARLVIGRGPVELVQQAPMDVRAAAHAVVPQHRRQDGPVAERGGDRAGQLAHQHRLVRRRRPRAPAPPSPRTAAARIRRGRSPARSPPRASPPAAGRRTGPAAAARPACRASPAGPPRRYRPAPARRSASRVRPNSRCSAASARRRKCRGQQSQGVPSVSRKSPSSRVMSGPSTAGIERLRRRIRHQHQVARGAERRVVDRAEGGQHDVAVGDADARDPSGSAAPRAGSTCRAAARPGRWCR